MRFMDPKSRTKVDSSLLLYFEKKAKGENFALEGEIPASDWHELANLRLYIGNGAQLPEL
jgi:hypothetical protein